MISLNNIKGNKTSIKYLKQCLVQKRTHNSYLFSGPDGIGKALTAKAFIGSLVCKNKTKEFEGCRECSSCKRIDLNEHPDVVWIEPEKNRSIKIEEIRKAKETLSLKPYESPLSICVIVDAHRMTVESSNALLKLLENPPGKSVLLLITNKKELILPTVISRCSEVRFSSLPIKDVTEIICQNIEIEKKEAEFLSFFSGGSPGKALEMVEDNVPERKNEIIDLYKEILDSKNEWCNNWDKEDKDSILEDIEILIMFFRDLVMLGEGNEDILLDRSLKEYNIEEVIEKYDVNKIFKILKNLIKLRSSLERNANPKIVAQVLPGMVT